MSSFESIAGLQHGQSVRLPLVGDDFDFIVDESADRDEVPLPGRVLLTWIPELGVTRIRIGGAAPGEVHGFEIAGQFSAIDFVVIPVPAAGEAYIRYAPGPGTATGDAGAELLVGGNYADVLDGGGGNDYLAGNGGNDSMSGGAGDDLFFGFTGNDTVRGDDGYDVLIYVQFDERGSSGLRVDLAAGTVQKASGTDLVQGIEMVSGTRFADTLLGSAAVDVLLGQLTDDFEAGGAYESLATGGDWIEGRGGSDAIQGSGGDDTLYGGSSQRGGVDEVDTFWFAASGNGIDEIRDFSASDRIFVRSPVAGGTVSAGSGSSVAAGSVQVSVASGITTLFVDTDGIAGADVIVRLAGSFDPRVFTVTWSAGFIVVTHGPPTTNGADNVVLTDAADGVHGQGGNDSLGGRAGDDSLFGEAGDDTLDGGSGSDRLDGGANGAAGDWVTYGQASGPVSVDLATGQGSDGSGGNDTLAGIENVATGSGHDTLRGDAGDNQLSGGDGNDLLDGAAGNNRLTGGAGDDTVIGSAGFDTIDAGTGVDTLVLADPGFQGGFVDLAGGILRGFGGTGTVTGIENVTGTSAGDTLVGSLGTNVIRGGGGSDDLYGQATESGLLGRYVGVANAGDSIAGGGFVDRIRGSTGDDTLWGDSEGAPDASGVDSFFFADRGNGVDLIADFTEMDNIFVGFTLQATLVPITRGNGSNLGAGAIQVQSTANESTLFIDTDGVAGADVVIRLAGGFDAPDIIASASAGSLVIGYRPRTTQGGDSVFLGGDDDLLHGLGGDDQLRGGGGNDTLFGDDGDDVITGGAGNDVLDGGAGSDWLQFADNGSSLAVDLEAARVAQDAEGGSDTITGFENVSGGVGNDTLLGSGADNVFRVGFGRDVVDGRGGFDTLLIGVFQASVDLHAGRMVNVQGLESSLVSIEAVQGSDSAVGDTLLLSNASGWASGLGGDDILSGRAGNDTLAGGPGSDTLTGGAGADVFVFGSTHSGIDLVTEFSAADVLRATPHDRPLQAVQARWSGDVTVLTLDWGIVQRQVHLSGTFDTTQFTLMPGANGEVDVRYAGPALQVMGRAEPGLVLSVASTVLGRPQVAHEWLADGVAVGAGTTLKLTADLAGKSIAVKATYTGYDGQAETITSAATTSVAVAATGIRGTVYHWKSHQLMPGVEVQIAGSTVSSTTGADGVFEVPVTGGSVVGLVASRAAADSASAITSADALAALRLAVGINPNANSDGFGPLGAPKVSPFQFIAADVNGDGRVSSADALAILRMAVKAANAPAAAWSFIDEKLDLWNEAAGAATLHRNAVAWDAALSGTPGPEQRLNLVAVLRGDVNGSWTSAGAQDLDVIDPNYFKLLGAQLQQPMDVWGG